MDFRQSFSSAILSTDMLWVIYIGYNGSLLIGALNTTDLSKIYGSAASAEYVPYIHDPEESLQSTTRLLYGR